MGCRRLQGRTCSRRASDAAELQDQERGRPQLAPPHTHACVQVVLCRGSILPMPFTGNRARIHSPTSTPQRAWLAEASQQLRTAREHTPRLAGAGSDRNREGASQVQGKASAMSGSEPRFQVAGRAREHPGPPAAGRVPALPAMAA